MGKRLNKKELLAEITDEREKLIAILGSLTQRQIAKRGRNDANWSIKDVVTHLFDWETRVIDWYELGQVNVQPSLPADGYKWSDIRRLNDDIRRKHQRKSVAVVLTCFEDAHVRTLDAVSRMTNSQLTKIGHFEWTGKSWTLSDYVRANTASHYKWARTKIRRWLRDEIGQTASPS